jgi:hypothetical protein
MEMSSQTTHMRGFRRAQKEALHFPLRQSAILHRYTSRTLSSPGALNAQKDHGYVVLAFLGGPNCAFCAACKDFEHFNSRLAMYIINCRPAYPGCVQPKKDGHGNYTPADLTQLLSERVLNMHLAPGKEPPLSVTISTRSSLPVVRLFRMLTITNKRLPGCVMMIRAYPFRGVTFHGKQRQVCLHLLVTSGLWCTCP